MDDGEVQGYGKPSQDDEAQNNNYSDMETEDKFEVVGKEIK